MPSLEALSMQLKQHLEDCYDVRVQTNETLEKLSGKLDNIEKLPFRAVKYLGGIVVVAAITNIVTTYLTHEETAQKAQQAAVSAQQAVAGQQQTLAVVKSIKATQNAATAPP